MKKVLIALTTGMVMMSCGNGATDGNPNTDTSSMKPDMGTDTSNSVNRNFGTAPSDTSMSGDSVRTGTSSTRNGGGSDSMRR